MRPSPRNNSGRKSRGYEAEWQERVKDIAAKRFDGLVVRCPHCKRNGTLVSKWVEGTPVKPLFVVHPNGNGHLDACALSKTEAATARTRISFTWADVRKTFSFGKLFVLFSGGRDSLCLLAYMKSLCKHTGREFVALHANTTAGFPEVEEYVVRVCRELKVPLVTVQPPYDFFDLAKRWGIPGVKSRWCCSALKIAPLRRYLAGIEGPKVIFDGIRAAESNIRSTYTPLWYHPSFRAICASPLFAWSDEKVRGYVEKNGLPASPAKELGTSAECWCGAYKCRSDFEKLLAVHPDIFDKLVDVERAQRGRYTFVYEEGKRIRLTEVRKQLARRTTQVSVE